MVEVSPVALHEVETADPELARRWLNGAYLEHAPQLPGPVEGFRLRASSAATNLFRVHEVRCTAHLRPTTEPFEALAMASVGNDGRWLQVRHENLVRDAAGVGDPHASRRAGLDPPDAQLVTLDLDAARTLAGELGGLPPERVHFGPSLPVSSDMARYWTRTVDFVVAQFLGNATATESRLLREQAWRSLVTATILTFPNTALAALGDPARRGVGSVEPATVRRAQEFMDAHAGEAVSIRAIADAARLSPRSLQAAFRRHRDQTPLEYLRQVRMARAHQDLRAGDRTRGDTVVAVAARWGFTHPGRFAVEYRKAYGSSPSATLRS